MINIEDFIDRFSDLFRGQQNILPWEITENLEKIIEKLIAELDHEYIVSNRVAIHRSAVIENGAVIKPPAVVGMNCIVKANAYFREGVYLDHSVSVGPGTEIKQSLIFSGSALAHFNYIGNSIIGRNVNFEAGSISANHYNERASREIFVKSDSAIIKTGVTKFGSLVGDNSKIGANAVLSPGTILEKNSIVKRLELVEQVRYDQ